MSQARAETTALRFYRAPRSISELTQILRRHRAGQYCSRDLFGFRASGRSSAYLRQEDQEDAETRIGVGARAREGDHVSRKPIPVERRASPSVESIPLTGQPLLRWTKSSHWRRS